MAGFLDNLVFQFEMRRRHQFARLLERIDPERFRITPRKPGKVRRLAFVTPHLSRHSGGITSVLRLGAHLSRMGVEVHYLTYTEQNPRQMAEVGSSMPGLKAHYARLSEAFDQPFDCAVATFWESAYDVAMMPRAERKAYFLQDFEPLFYPASDAYHFAMGTYRLGLQMISLGGWIKAQVERTLPDVHVESVPFPYEPSEYQTPFSDAKFQSRREVNTCAYVKVEERRAPLLILKCLAALDRRLKAEGYASKIKVFGLSKGVRTPVGENLGQLSRPELAELYAQSDFGVVASLTNISLVPYEMMACYCPVVDFTFGSFLHFFPRDVAILSEGYPQSFAEQVMYYVNHPEERKALAVRAKAALVDLSWEETARQFLERLETVPSTAW